MGGSQNLWVIIRLQMIWNKFSMGVFLFQIQLYKVCSLKKDVFWRVLMKWHGVGGWFVYSMWTVLLLCVVVLIISRYLQMWVLLCGERILNHTLEIFLAVSSVCRFIVTGYKNWCSCARANNESLLSWLHEIKTLVFV